MKRLAVIFILMSVSCSRRPLVGEVCVDNLSTAVIPVAVDWSISGITPAEGVNDEDYVHRVSLRFFPVDGSEPFDRYLESNIYEGEIEVPIGEYSVVVFNESIYDTFWSDVYRFENVDDFDNFIAVLIEDELSAEYSTEAYKLASWSVEHFEVTQSMVNTTRLAQSYTRLSSEETRMLTTLEDIILQPLTCYINVSANIQYLSSAQYVACEVTGFADRVYMASGESHSTQTLHKVELVDREYSDDENKHGTISESRLVLSKSTDDAAEYKLLFEIYLTDGTQHSPDEPLEFDVSHQVTRYATDDYDLSADLELPEVTSGIDVEGWSDEEVVTLN